MTMPFLSDTVICFDLDDTLYKEIDFLKSAYKEVAAATGNPEAAEQMLDWYYAKENVFAKLIETNQSSFRIADCLKIYRNHFPQIALDEGVRDYLVKLKKSDAKMGVISDGRSVTQRNKLEALGLDGFFDIVIISEEFGTEKPCLRNYQAVQEVFPERKKFIYVGDNPAKDFLAPNQLGWWTYCLKNDGRNIHIQDFSLTKDYAPQFVIDHLKDLGF